MKTYRLEPEIATLGGRHSVSFLDPDPDTMCIEDIANALAQLNRYTGHTPYPYSVAQHCVLASRMIVPELSFEMLMHDAQEAYVGDVSSPLKQLLPDYQEIEERLETVVRRKFGLPPKMTLHVKEVDTRMLVTEAKAFGLPWWPEFGLEPYLPDLIKPWSWEEARDAFLYAFDRLGLEE